MSKTKKVHTILLLLILILFITIISFSFAAFTTRITNSETTSTLITGSGVMQITFEGGEAINAPNIYPKEEEFLTKTFTLNGKNTYNTKMEYHLILKMNSNTFRDGALAYTLTSVNHNNNGETAPNIEYLNNIKTGEREVFLGNGFFEGISDDTHTYTLKMYLPLIENFDHSVDQDKEFTARIEVREGEVYPGYNEAKGVNHPVLFTGMTPVKWDGTTEIETTEDDPDWYDYNEKRWANAKSQDGSYWVWIPRYAYKIESCYHTSGEDCFNLTGKEAGDINIKFLKSTTNITEDNTIIETTGYEAHEKDTSMHHFLHPAFQFNGDELGFWVAKFEASAHEGLSSGVASCSGDNVTNKSPKIVPNVTPWRCINISNAYKTSLMMKDNLIYGWQSAELDSHMMTNHEWGAVANLSNSPYGANGKVWNNSFVEFKTGCAASTAESTSELICHEYKSELGVKASTTHNIYGIYDMSGGAWEVVMGNYNNIVGISGFTTEEMSSINYKYISRYETNLEDMLNGVSMAYNPNIYGDATYEVSENAARFNGTNYIGNPIASWYKGFSYIPYRAGHLIRRGGHFSSGYGAGVYNFSFGAGNIVYDASFRPVLTPLS